MLTETNLMLSTVLICAVFVFFVLSIAFYYHVEVRKPPHYRPFNIDFSILWFALLFALCGVAVTNEWIRFGAINPNSSADDPSRAFSPTGLTTAGVGVCAALVAFIYYRFVCRVPMELSSTSGGDNR